MRLLALAGGVGGAKLAHGLAQILPPENLTVIVNTGDDFEHYGLYICPDLDTVCYTLAGLANPKTGWGRAGESWRAIASAVRLGGPDWFRLGDHDLGTHLERTRRLKEGQSLSQITRDFCKAWGIQQTILPMSDAPVRTIVETDEGDLPFQEYFVHRRCEPRVEGFRFAGVEDAQPAPGAREALESAEAVVICPSNPWVSIDPILSVLSLTPTPLPGGEGRRGEGKSITAVSPTPLPGGKGRRGERKSITAVSPIIAGKAIKGPAAKMCAELGIQPSALAVAEHYRGLLTGFVLDTVDSRLAPDIRQLEMETLVTDTLMRSDADRRRLAEDVLHFIGRLSQ